MTNKVFVFLFDGFSDWEISYFTPEIKKSENFELVYFSIDGRSVVSMGGLHVNPDISLSEINLNEVYTLVLPGGTMWANGENEILKAFVLKVAKCGKTIAAICAATVFLAQLGLLDDLRHTSNDLNYLKAVVPQYKGDKYYVNTLAVADRNMITACGIAPIEFAYELLKKINLFNDSQADKWFQLFKNGIWSE